MLFCDVIQENNQIAHDNDAGETNFAVFSFVFQTVLHWGAKHGNAEIIKAFAGTYKVDVNSKTNGGYTPLHIAAQFGHKNIFKLLIEVYKANSNVRDYSGRTPEYYLLAKEQTGPKNNVRSEYKGEPMHVVTKPLSRKGTLKKVLYNSKGPQFTTSELPHKSLTGYYQINTD
ncbi:hypothetical protein WA026_020399 [Henosepilachna vigintioctopunctata]|uniref:Uncharacterized protein n=1 Tax=Henosepilachna vigintioctopunctata TaxID=420089 RepID=A0AAW1UQM6_9CUCU